MFLYYLKIIDKAFAAWYTHGRANARTYRDAAVAPQGRTRSVP